MLSPCFKESSIHDTGANERILYDVAPVATSVYSAYSDNLQHFQAPQHPHQIFQIQPTIGQNATSNDLLLAEFRRKTSSVIISF